MAFIPLYDTNPHRYIGRGGQSVTVALIIVNCVVYLGFQSGYLFKIPDETILSFALIPADFNGLESAPDGFLAIPQFATLLTYSFLHGDLWHLLGNMIFLWVFGDNVEDAVGHWKFLAFYCLSAIAAGLVHAFAVPDSEAALVGASGAVAAIVVAYLLLYPKAKIWILFLGRVPLHLAAVWVLGGWIAIQFWSVFAGGEDDIGWWAHLGGMGAGAILIVVLHRRGVHFFGRQDPVPAVASAALATPLAESAEPVSPTPPPEASPRFDSP